MTSTRSEVYEIINGERLYQDRNGFGEYGRRDGCQKSIGDYLTVIRAYSEYADLAYLRGDIPALDAIRKIAAVCVQAMEVHGALRRSP